jgi:hypothetical protein
MGVICKAMISETWMVVVEKENIASANYISCDILHIWFDSSLGSHFLLLQVLLYDR